MIKLTKPSPVSEEVLITHYLFIEGNYVSIYLRWDEPLGKAQVAVQL